MAWLAWDARFKGRACTSAGDRTISAAVEFRDAGESNMRVVDFLGAEVSSSLSSDA